MQNSNDQFDLLFINKLIKNSQESKNQSVVEDLFKTTVLDQKIKVDKQEILPKVWNRETKFTQYGLPNFHVKDKKFKTSKSDLKRLRREREDVADKIKNLNQSRVSPKYNYKDYEVRLDDVTDTGTYMARSIRKEATNGIDICIPNDAAMVDLLSEVKTEDQVVRSLAYRVNMDLGSVHPKANEDYNELLTLMNQIKTYAYKDKDQYQDIMKKKHVSREILRYKRRADMGNTEIQRSDLDDFIDDIEEKYDEMVEQDREYVDNLNEDDFILNYDTHSSAIPPRVVRNRIASTTRIATTRVVDAKMNVTAQEHAKLHGIMVINAIERGGGDYEPIRMGLNQIWGRHDDHEDGAFIGKNEDINLIGDLSFATYCAMDTKLTFSKYANPGLTAIIKTGPSALSKEFMGENVIANWSRANVGATTGLRSELALCHDSILQGHLNMEDRYILIDTRVLRRGAFSDLVFEYVDIDFKSMKIPKFMLDHMKDVCSNSFRARFLKLSGFYGSYLGVPMAGYDVPNAGASMKWNTEVSNRDLAYIDVSDNNKYIEDDDVLNEIDQHRQRRKKFPKTIDPGANMNDIMAIFRHFYNSRRMNNTEIMGQVCFIKTCIKMPQSIRKQTVLVLANYLCRLKNLMLLVTEVMKRSTKYMIEANHLGILKDVDNRTKVSHALLAAHFAQEIIITERGVNSGWIKAKMTKIMNDYKVKKLVPFKTNTQRFRTKGELERVIKEVRNATVGMFRQRYVSKASACRRIAENLIPSEIKNLVTTEQMLYTFMNQYIEYIRMELVWDKKVGSIKVIPQYDMFLKKAKLMSMHVKETYKFVQELPDTLNFFSFEKVINRLKGDNEQWILMHGKDTTTFKKFNPLYLLFAKYADYIKTHATDYPKLEQYGRSQSYRVFNEGKLIASIREDRTGEQKKDRIEQIHKSKFGQTYKQLKNMDSMQQAAKSQGKFDMGVLLYKAMDSFQIDENMKQGLVKKVTQLMAQAVNNDPNAAQNIDYNQIAHSIRTNLAGLKVAEQLTGLFRTEQQSTQDERYDLQNRVYRLLAQLEEKVRKTKNYYFDDSHRDVIVMRITAKPELLEQLLKMVKMEQNDFEINYPYYMTCMDIEDYDATHTDDIFKDLGIMNTDSDDDQEGEDEIV